MIEGLSVRIALASDIDAIRNLTTRAFGREDEARIIDQLAKDGDILLQMVAELEGKIVGHVLVYALGVHGRLGAMGVGPMSVEPWVQREGVGSALLLRCLAELKTNGVPLVFVLGHADYYPRFGFSVEETEPFETTLKGPNFMALRMRYGPPMSGRLLFPAAFGVAG